MSNAWRFIRFDDGEYEICMGTFYIQARGDPDAGPLTSQLVFDAWQLMERDSGHMNFEEWVERYERQSSEANQNLLNRLKKSAARRRRDAQ